jgi:uncharacterized protein YbbK (DUF523 family)
MYLVSACLCGVDCKYNGGNNFSEKINKLLEEGKAIPICPEQLGGLPTPRHPAELYKCSAKEVLEGRGKVLNNKGEDVTEFFIKGARESHKIARSSGCSIAVLKARSPSCGCGKIYDGSFSGGLREGNGVTSQLLLDNGIKVYTEEDF